MRAGVALAALAHEHDVHVVVVPVVGAPGPSDWALTHAAELTIAPLLTTDTSARELVDLLATAGWRDRLAAAEPLPELARRASPALARLVVESADLPRGAPIHVIRSYLAPLGVALAERLGSAWATLDLDDDDEMLLREEGDADESRAVGRVLRVFAPEFAWCALASHEEASAVAERTGLVCHALPNAVQVPDPAPARRPPRDRLRLLFVGNLTYEPNIEAAEVLARRVARVARKRVEGEVVVSLVGRFDSGSPVEKLALEEGVELHGYVQELADHYATASVVVAPLMSGAGTRIKLLEAFAHRVPVVSTPEGAAGLDVEHERHLLIATSPRRLGAAVARLADDVELAARLVREAAALVEERYSVDVVGRLLRELLPSPR